MIAAVSRAPDLDDPDGLIAADVEGMLRATASAGALVRATAAAVEEGALDALRGASVRSVVLAASHGPAQQAAQLVAALAESASTVPVVAVRAVPRWLGPLDVLVVLSDDAGDLDLAEAVVRAGRRGTHVVLGAADEGPLGAAGGGTALRLAPRVPVPPSASLLRFVSTALAALGAAGVDGALGVGGGLDLFGLADVLDVEAARDHPSGEVFASPAKSLAARMRDHALVLAGAGPVTEIVARHGAAGLLRHAGRPASATGLGEALGAPVARGGEHRVDALFYDPELDGPRPDGAARVLVIATGAEREHAERRLGGLADAHLVTASEPDAPPAGGVVAEVGVLAARLETAAVYLGLVG